MTFEQKISEEIKRIYRKICSLWAAVETLQTDVSTITADVTNLKNNELKITYYEIVSGASGTITPPTGATFNSDEFGNSGNSILSRINGANKPTYESPKTAGGVVVTANLNTTTGAWVASGTYTDTNVALIYSINIKEKDYANLNNFYIIEETKLSGGSGDITIGTTPITGGGSGRILFESATGKVSEDSNLTFISQQLTVNGQLNLGTGSIPANTGVNNELQKYYSERVYKYNSALTILHKNNTFEMEFGSYDGDYYWYGVNSSFTGYSWGCNLNQQLFRIERTGNVGVNIYSPQARFHIIDTAEQLRIGYDGSNYLKVTVGSTGLVTYDAVGSGAGFKFMKPINLQNIPTSSAGLSSGDIWNDSGTLKIV